MNAVLLLCLQAGAAGLEPVSEIAVERSVALAADDAVSGKARAATFDRFHELIWGGPPPDLPAWSRDAAFAQLGPDEIRAMELLLTRGIKGLPVPEPLGRPVMEALTQGFEHHEFISMEHGGWDLDARGRAELAAFADDLREPILAGEGWLVLLGFASPDTDAPDRRERRRNWRLADKRVFEVRNYLYERQDVPTAAIFPAPVGQHDTFFPTWRDVGNDCPSEAGVRGGPRSGSEAADAGCRQGVMVLYVTWKDIAELRALLGDGAYAFTAPDSPWASVATVSASALPGESLDGVDFPAPAVSEFADIVPPRIREADQRARLGDDTREARALCDRMARGGYVLVEDPRTLRAGDVTDLDASELLFTGDQLGLSPADTSGEPRAYTVRVDLDDPGALDRVTLGALTWTELDQPPAPSRRDRGQVYVTLFVHEQWLPSAALALDGTSDRGYALASKAVGALEGEAIRLDIPGDRERLAAPHYPALATAVRWLGDEVTVQAANPPRRARAQHRLDEAMLRLQLELQASTQQRFLAQLQPVYPQREPAGARRVLRADLSLDLMGGEELLLGEEKFLVNQFQLQGLADSQLEALDLVGVRSTRLRCEAELGGLLAVE